MSTVKVSALPEKLTLDGTEELFINDSGTSKKLSASLFTAIQTASEAAQTAAETAETNAETAETNAASSASAASTSATAAATSASAASTSASSASSSASSASSSASAASSSASAASSAQSAAESARDATLAAYDSFDDRYLGTKASAPSVDNDGNALVAGALYFNSTTEKMQLYTGSSWVDAYTTGSGFLIDTNNLSDLDNVSTARTNLGLGSAATTASTDYATAAQGILATSALQNITGESIKDLSDVYSSMTPSDGQLLTWDTTNGWQAEDAPVSLPTQTGHSGEYLTTDGSTASWVALSSESLSKTFPLASGGSVTANKAVAINSSGEVGEYPATNSYGTAQGSASTDYYYAVSNDGTRAIRCVVTQSPSTASVTIYGYAITNSGTAVTGTSQSFSSVTHSGNYYGGNNYSAGVGSFNMGNSTFVVGLSQRTYNYTGTNYYMGSMMAYGVSVDASGNVTLGSSASTSSTSTSSGYGGSIYKITDSVFAIYSYAGGSYNGLACSLTGTSITSSGDTTDVVTWASYANGTSTITSNNIMVGGNGNTIYYGSYTTNNFPTPSSTGSIISDYSSGGKWFFVNQSQAIVHYVNTDSETCYANISINQTTGAATHLDSATITVDTYGSADVPTNIVTNNGTDFVGHKDGYVFTFKIDGSGDFYKTGTALKVGLTEPLSQYSSNAYLRYNTTDTYWISYKNTSGDIKMVPLTVGAYAADPFIVGGISTETTSSSNPLVTIRGVASGFSGLTINSDYYIDSSLLDGTLSTSGTPLVGRAISSTELLLTFS
jgi:hypothetical protein